MVFFKVFVRVGTSLLCCNEQGRYRQANGSAKGRSVHGLGRGPEAARALVNALQEDIGPGVKTGDQAALPAVDEEPDGGFRPGEHVVVRVRMYLR